MTTTIQATSTSTRTDADARLIRQARSLARRLKHVDPNGATARMITRQYKRIVKQLGYDPIS
ncbi:hypothetical protein [Micromonospora aurantiaca (nom. illeg.)]|uniref:hypothetical protein n=1 Tax=Micromonospora aurantiaca (nom. illeg.) TaxID=47850 RepID=UPI0033EDB56F